MKFELIERYHNIPEQDMIDDVMAVAKKLGKDSITGREYTRHGKYSYGGLQHRFRSWEVVLQRAGLKATKLPRGKAAEEFLFENLAGVWIKLGRQPSCHDMKRPLSRYDSRSYARHFGTWSNALKKFVEYKNAELPGSAGIVKKPAPLQEMKEEVTPRSAPPLLKLRVFKRDRYCCVRCGKSPATHPGLVLHCDHIKPWSLGGETTYDNLQTLCSECNLSKGSKTGMVVRI